MTSSKDLHPVHELALHPLRGIEFCAGIGGLALGLKLALGDAYRTTCYVEVEAFAASVLEARIKDRLICEAVIWSDIATFDAGPWRGKVDLISGGFPCTPFSAAGKRRGADDPRHLWPHFVRHIETIGPAMVFCENVPGLLTLGFKQVCEDLSRLGYRTQAGVYSAAEQGAPHLRKRLFFLAYADSEQLRHAGESIGGAQRQSASKFKSNGEQGHVADADSKLWRFRNAGAAGCDLAGADHGLQSQQQKNFGGPAISSADVANADSNRLLRRRAKQSGSKHAASALSGEAVADLNVLDCGQREPEPTSFQRWFRAQGGSWHQAACRPAECRLGRDSSGFSRGLDEPRTAQCEEAWELGVPRTAVGQAHRIDRLRALGNAVVPQVAEFAFKDLLRQALDDVAD